MANGLWLTISVTHTNCIMYREIPFMCTFLSDVISCCFWRIWCGAPKWILPYAAPHSLLDVRGTVHKLFGRSGFVHCLSTCHFAVHNLPGVSEWRNIQARGRCQLFNHQQHEGMICRLTDILEPSLRQTGRRGGGFLKILSFWVEKGPAEEATDAPQP
jgi:hypothetical protein